jgi:PAS domain S-box-containing protein
MEGAGVRPASIEVPPEIVRKWQEIVNLIAEIVGVPAALIMKVEPPIIKVFLSSESAGNPYHRDEKANLNTGLYCETVMRTREPLLVPDALAEAEWAENPDIELGMISYLGFPIVWPTGEVFGTICVLDDKRNEYNSLHQRLLLQFRNTVQADLISLTETEARLRRDRAYLDEAQTLSRTGSFGWNVSSGELSWSAETFQIFGYDPAISPSIDALIQRVHPEDITLVRSTLERATRQKTKIDYEHRLQMPDGSVKHLHVVAHAMNDEPGNLQFAGAVMDVSAAKRAREQLEQAQAELAYVTRVTTLGEITASIAHEVSQPLAAITTNGQASLRFLDAAPPKLDKVRGALKRMVDDSRRAAEIVQKTRALTKRAKPQWVELDPNAIIGETVSLLQREIATHRATLRLELVPRLPAVLGDRVQLQQVIINLIINGLQAMAAVDDRPRELVVRSHPDDARNQVVVSVRDAGAGIAPENAARLFEAFFTTKPNGMGMGLSICRTIVEAHGGRVWASGNSGPGATFLFSLPSSREGAGVPARG